LLGIRKNWEKIGKKRQIGKKIKKLGRIGGN
jgi:hypothetical protein